MIRVLCLTLALLAAPTAGFAQSPNPNDEPVAEVKTESGPDPVVGYAVCSLLAAVAIFAVCKSARR